MAKIQSLKDIMSSEHFLKQQSLSRRYVHHEFQDYAYRLASDLGDVAHKAIYMRLAKNVDRGLMEQAAMFALGYQLEPNKGKIFMWKLSQLRAEKQRKTDMLNHDHDFVLQKTAELQNQLAEVFMAKDKKRYQEEYSDQLAAFCQQIAANHTSKKPPKLLYLSIGCAAGLKFVADVFKVEASDLSANVVKVAKQICAKAKITRKSDFLNAKYKDETFDAIWVGRDLWSAIPLAAEAKYLVQFHKWLRTDGLLYIDFSGHQESEEIWSQFEWKEQTYIKFTKHNSEIDLSKSLTAAGFAALSDRSYRKTAVT